MRINLPLPSTTRAATKKLRARMTDAERTLWFRLRGGRLGELKFRRQHPLPPYVVDFYCSVARLAVEVDGSQHAPDVDATRTHAIERQGIMLLRFWGNQVLNEIDGVLRVILDVARTRTLTRPFGAPSPTGRGEKTQ